jgi:hypothetical protein
MKTQKDQIKKMFKKIQNAHLKKNGEDLSLVSAYPISVKEIVKCYLESGMEKAIEKLEQTALRLKGNSPTKK